PRRDGGDGRRLGDKRRGQRAKRRGFLGKPRGDRLAGDVAAGLEPRIHAREERQIDPFQCRRARNRRERLSPQRFAAGLHAAFVVAFARPTDARLEEVMRRGRHKARRQRPLTPDENPGDRRLEIVVRQPGRHAAEVRERAHVAIEKADLVLPLVDPREVAAGVHQPHQEEPRLAAGAVPLAAGPGAIGLLPPSTATPPEPANPPPPPRPPPLPAAARRRCHAPTTSFTSVSPPWWPSPTSNPCSRVAVSSCLPPVHCGDSPSNASIRAPTFSHTGRGRGPVSFRTGTGSSTYLRTV